MAGVRSPTWPTSRSSEWQVCPGSPCLKHLYPPLNEDAAYGRSKPVTGSADALTVAGINATVLSILFAGAVAWFALYYAPREQLKAEAEQKILDLGVQIARLRPWGTILIGGMETFDASDRPKRREIAQRLGFAFRTSRLRDGSGRPLEVGEAIKQMIGALVNAGPFSHATIDSVDAARTWAEEAEDLALYLLRSLEHGGQRFDSFIRDYADASARWRFESTRAPDQPPPPPGWMERDIAREEGSFRELIQGLAHMLENAVTIAVNLRPEVSRYDRLVQRRPLARKSAGAWVTAALVAFAAGVVVPELWPDVPRLVPALVPIGFYFVVTTSALRRLLREYGAAGKGT
jgi:hypothetical protein